MKKRQKIALLCSAFICSGLAPFKMHSSLNAFSSKNDVVLNRMRSIIQEMNYLFDEFSDFPDTPLGHWSKNVAEMDIPAIETPQVQESDTATTLTFKLNDCKKDDIKVSVQTNDSKKYLFISVKKTSTKEEAESRKDTPGAQVKRVEKSIGRFDYQTLLRPFEKDKEISSKFENGILTITIPVDAQKKADYTNKAQSNIRSIKID